MSRPIPVVLLAYIAVADALPRSQVIDPSRSVKFPYSSPPHYHRWTSSGLSIREREGLTNSTRGGGQGGIVFPTEHPLAEQNTDHIKISQPIESCSDGSKFCDMDPDYPQTLLENMLKEYAVEYQALFGSDLLEDNSVKHRIGSPHENPLCASRVHIIYPKKAEDKDGQLKYVVNTDEHKQGVRIETCVSEGSPCQFSEAFPASYKVTCRQRHVYRKLVALSDNKLEPGLFSMPSCCMCMVESVPLVFGMGESPGLESRARTPQDQPHKDDSRKGDVSTRSTTPTKITVKSFEYGEDQQPT